MDWSFMFFVNSMLMGVGLAMDAFSVSMANGLNEPRMSRSKLIGIASTFAVFQALMPMAGWLCVHTILELFSSFQKFIPWIALVLLLYIGGKMILDGIRQKEGDESPAVGFWGLMLQGVATSIDALSVGFTIAELDWIHAVTESIIIAAVTFVICVCGVLIGRKFGTKLSNKATILGGVILVAIGIEIFITGVFG